MAKKDKHTNITVVIKEPGKAAYVDIIPNTLQALQGVVGGYIETFGFAQDACVICNEEGRLLGLPENVMLFGQTFVGTVLVVGVNGEEFTSVRSAHVPLLIKTLNGGAV